jgi:hypothetical protein
LDNQKLILEKSQWRAGASKEANPRPVRSAEFGGRSGPARLIREEVRGLCAARKRKEAAECGGLLSSQPPNFRLFQLGGDAAEAGIQLGADAVDGGDDGNRDARGDQAVFNGRRSRLILQKPGEKLRHEIAPSVCAGGLCASGDAEGLNPMMKNSIMKLTLSNGKFE